MFLTLSVAIICGKVDPTLVNGVVVSIKPHKGCHVDLWTPDSTNSTNLRILRTMLSSLFDLQTAKLKYFVHRETLKLFAPMQTSVQSSRVLRIIEEKARLDAQAVTKQETPIISTLIKEEQPKVEPVHVDLPQEVQTEIIVVSESNNVIDITNTPLIEPIEQTTSDTDTSSETEHVASDTEISSLPCEIESIGDKKEINSNPLSRAEKKRLRKKARKHAKKALEVVEIPKEIKIENVPILSKPKKETSICAQATALVLLATTFTAVISYFIY